MTMNSIVITTDQEMQPGYPLAIKIEPSVPILVSMAKLFRSHQQTVNALEICRLAVTYFPANLEIRLLMALTHLDMKQANDALAELETVWENLICLAPLLEEVGKLEKEAGQDSLSDWAFQMADLLGRFPSQSDPKEAFRVESKVIPTLTHWVNQLKAERA
jgi:hypothetical protein